MTKKQIYRAYRRAWERMTRGDGYQAFGYDYVTLWATKPEWCIALKRLSDMWKQASE